MAEEKIIYFVDPTNDIFQPLTAGTTGTHTIFGVQSKKNQSIEVPNVIYNGIAMGLSYETAANLAGVDRVTFQGWLNDDPILKTKIEKARAWGVNFVVGKLWEAINRNEKWAIQFYLGRRAEEFKETKIELKQEGISEDTLKEIINMISNNQNLLPKKDDDSSRNSK